MKLNIRFIQSAFTVRKSNFQVFLVLFQTCCAVENIFNLENNKFVKYTFSVSVMTGK